LVFSDNIEKNLPRGLNMMSGGAVLMVIYLAGGCFWGVEEFMSRIPGVVETTVGYANGATENPTYEEVCSGKTGYAETVEVRYDPGVVSLDAVLRAYFSVIDPVSVNRQGNDRGSQYRTGVYYVRPEDRETALGVFAAVQREYSSPLAVELKPLENFSMAEEYHQKYLKKNPNGYCHIDLNALDGLDLGGGK
jgi:peptide methionine sulfoxide reductase msrA/msrB